MTPIVLSSHETAVWLGVGLEIEAIHKRQKYAAEWSASDGPDMLWLERAKALLFTFVAGRRRGKANHNQTFSRWHERDPRNDFSLSLKIGRWREVGQVRRIDYWSDKWGVADEYTHKVGKGATWWVSGEIMVIKGEKLRVTERGLVG